MKAQFRVPIEELRNIGPTIASRLRAVGIRTRADLLAIGPAGACRRIRAKYPDKRIPVCYYLYSLEGALRDEHWDALPAAVKRELRRQVSV